MAKAPPGVTIEGLKEFRLALRKLPPEYVKALREITKAAAEPVAEEARHLVPVGPTGRLKASIRALGQQRGAQVAAGKKSVPYAGPIHWGWPKRHIRAQPFLVRALHKKQKDVILVFEIKTQKLLDRAFGHIRGGKK